MEILCKTKTGKWFRNEGIKDSKRWRRPKKFPGNSPFSANYFLSIPI
jgi:hypothetical protein